MAIKRHLNAILRRVARIAMLREVLKREVPRRALDASPIVDRVRPLAGDKRLERELSGAREAFVAGKGPDAVNYWASIQGAARDFALEHFAEHGDAGDAAQYGVEMAFNRHFEIADSNRVKAAVPRSSGATAEQVEYFASQA
ncbi:MAG: hypothetical protein AAFX59_17310, partial [Pseudomonadota bacterium]